MYYRVLVELITEYLSKFGAYPVISREEDSEYVLGEFVTYNVVTFSPFNQALLLKRVNVRNIQLHSTNASLSEIVVKDEQKCHDVEKHVTMVRRALNPPLHVKAQYHPHSKMSLLGNLPTEVTRLLFLSLDNSSDLLHIALHK